MNVLVTGADGMLAKAIYNIYQNSGLNITFCNRKELDITSLEALKGYLNKNHFNFIINCAAYTNVEMAESDVEAAYAVNQIGAKNLAIAAHLTNSFLIHISTDAVYDGNKNGVYLERDSCNPLSVYSKSKYAGEIEIQKNHNYGIIIRTSWLYSLDKSNFVTSIINKAKSNGTLNVVYDQLGTPTYSYDLARFILDIIESGKAVQNSGIDIYHYSNEGAISWYDFAIHICRALQINVDIFPVSTNQYPTKVIRPFHAILSKDKIKETFGITIPYWVDSLEKCLSLYKNQ